MNCAESLKFEEDKCRRGRV